MYKHDTLFAFIAIENEEGKIIVTIQVGSKSNLLYENGREKRLILGIHHIALILSSEETLDFYKHLGFTESFRKIRENDTIVLLDGYGIQLEVFIDNRHPKRPEGLNEPLGIRHLALKVNAPLEEIINKIKELIIEPLEESNIGPIMTDWLGSRFIFVKDPDGNTLELHE